MFKVISNLKSISRISANTSFLYTPKNFGITAAAILGGSSLFGGALSGLFGSSQQNKVNKMNYRIWQEQKDFSHNEAALQRQWTQRMQDMYGTSSAKANNLRAAGLNSKLADTSMSQIGSGATAQTPGAPTMQSYNAGADIAQGINGGVQSFLAAYDSETQRRSQESQQSVNESLTALNDSVTKLNYKKVDLTDEGVRQLRLNNEFLEDTFSSRVRQQFSQEQIALWTQQDVKYSALAQRFGLMSLMPAQVQNLQAQSAYFQANMFKAVADGMLTFKDVEYYQRNFALRQTMAAAQMIGAHAQETSASAAMMNAKEYSKLLHSQKVSQDIKNAYDRYANDFWLGNLPPETIAKSAPLRSLLQSTLELNLYTAEKMRLEPKLVEALTQNYHSQSDLNYSQSRYYNWKKYSDAANAGANFVHSVRSGASAGASFVGSAVQAILK